MITTTTSDPELQRVAALVSEHSEPFRRLDEQIQQVIVGQQRLIHAMLVGLLSNGHLLIEGLPGLAKTTAVACLAAGIDASFSRIQFTPDLLPADLVGTQIYRPGTGDFTVRKGPIFASIVLADEINRAPAKVQSALLEAMQERQVTIGGETFPLPSPFLVLATQNPIEQEGTYQLPEAQVDRFLLKVVVHYPTRDEERRILDRMGSTAPVHTIAPVMSRDAIAAARRVVDQIYLDPKIKEYIVGLVFATREPAAAKVPIAGMLAFGASPRATIGLALAAKANAFLGGRAFVLPQDVKEIALEVLRHRIGLTYEAEAEGRTTDDIVKQVLSHVRVP
ncbi:MAG TPA: MoxR family ATPase [Phycisphaerales bacterium]|nr:MoxR family ATPase [Phycisphaerales bacterium]HMP38078.1 MoxR family ATPase [Phycisphaerales bacterium]